MSLIGRFDLYDSLTVRFGLFGISLIISAGWLVTDWIYNLLIGFVVRSVVALCHRHWAKLFQVLCFTRRASMRACAAFHRRSYPNMPRLIHSVMNPVMSLFESTKEQLPIWDCYSSDLRIDSLASVKSNCPSVSRYRSSNCGTSGW